MKVWEFVEYLDSFSAFVPLNEDRSPAWCNHQILAQATRRGKSLVWRPKIGKLETIKTWKILATNLPQQVARDGSLLHQHSLDQSSYWMSKRVVSNSMLDYLRCKTEHWVPSYGHQLHIRTTGRYSPWFHCYYLLSAFFKFRTQHVTPEHNWIKWQGRTIGKIILPVRASHNP